MLDVSIETGDGNEAALKVGFRLSEPFGTPPLDHWRTMNVIPWPIAGDSRELASVAVNQIVRSVGDAGRKCVLTNEVQESLAALIMADFAKRADESLDRLGAPGAPGTPREEVVQVLHDDGKPALLLGFPLFVDPTVEPGQLILRPTADPEQHEWLVGNGSAGRFIADRAGEFYSPEAIEQIKQAERGASESNPQAPRPEEVPITAEWLDGDDGAEIMGVDESSARIALAFLLSEPIPDGRPEYADIRRVVVCVDIAWPLDLAQAVATITDALTDRVQSAGRTLELARSQIISLFTQVQVAANVYSEELLALAGSVEPEPEILALPMVAARLVLEEFARRDPITAKAYLGLPTELKDEHSCTWQVTWQKPETIKVMREGLSERDQQRFEEGIADTSLYTLQKPGKSGVKLIRKGLTDVEREKRVEGEKLAQDYAVAERHRRVLEGESREMYARHVEKFPPERFEEERERAYTAYEERQADFEKRKQEAEDAGAEFKETFTEVFSEAKFTPPPFVYIRQDTLKRREKECEELLQKMKALKNSSPTQMKEYFFFPEGEPPRFVIL